MEEVKIDGIPTGDYGKPWSKSFYPEFQQTENGCKVSVPIISDLELQEIDLNIEKHYESIIEEVSKAVSKDKEIIILQRIIKNQDEQIKMLRELLDERSNTDER